MITWAYRHLAHLCRRGNHILSCSATSKHKKRNTKKRYTMDFNQGLNIAVEGCCHGELDTIYAAIQKLEQTERIRVDLLICCGDFQAVRNMNDLECMAVPNKYKKIMHFYKYYNGTKKAPYPTLFIGGNHEAIHYLRELYYGGWVAPDIYFLGYSGVVNFGGVRIAGISGIYNERHYNMGYHEKLPYHAGHVRSAYHVRSFDVFKLKQIKEKVDIFLSHDWPDCVTEWGNKQQLIQRKPYFRQEVEDRCLGSPVLTELLHALQPDYHFAGHLHVKFPALVDHGNGTKTRFLALDKCLPRRDFLQIINIPTATGPKEFSYDSEWLSIVHNTIHLMSFSQRQTPLTASRSTSRTAADEMKEQVIRRLGTMTIPHNFVPTAAAFSEQDQKRQRRMPQSDVRNPQTEQFLEMLGIPYNLDFGNQKSLPSEYAEDYLNEADDVEEEMKAIDASFIQFEDRGPVE